MLNEIRKLADKDPGHRKIFVRGLGWDTTTDTLKTVFSQFGEVEEGAVIMDKGTGKSRGFGFVTFKHMDGAQRSLKEPSKRIDGRMTVCQLASTGALQVNPNQEVSQRKIYVGNVPLDLSADRLLALFAGYGEIEEGPLGFDKYTGRSRGFALIIYKTVDAAKRALLEPIKTIDGIQMYCKLAAENQKQQQRRQGPGGKGDNDLVLGRQQVLFIPFPVGFGDFSDPRIKAWMFAGLYTSVAVEWAEHAIWFHEHRADNNRNSYEPGRESRFEPRAPARLERTEWLIESVSELSTEFIAVIVRTVVESINERFLELQPEL